MRNPVEREILLALWKIHILHHAGEEPIYGFAMIGELARHGYSLSPGTLYPILRRMERNGWLRSSEGATPKAARLYRITREGRRILRLLRRQIQELHAEVVGE